jgi:hypothetical protein
MVFLIPDGAFTFPSAGGRIAVLHGVCAVHELMRVNMPGGGIRYYPTPPNVSVVCTDSQIRYQESL